MTAATIKTKYTDNLSKIGGEDHFTDYRKINDFLLAVYLDAEVDKKQEEIRELVEKVLANRGKQIAKYYYQGKCNKLSIDTLVLVGCLCGPDYFESVYPVSEYRIKKKPVMIKPKKKWADY